MKKIILLLAGTAFSMAVATAQTDSTKTKTTTKTTTTQSTAYQSYPTKDMKKITQNEIPAPLRTTLQGSEYKGWENGTIYFNSMTNEYAWQAPVSTSTSATTTKTTTWYRFDKSGKRIPDTKP